jgi:hypothetical protein
VPEIRKNVWNCIVLNGFIFLGSLVLFRAGVVPLIDIVFSYTIASSESSFTIHNIWYVLWAQSR